MVALIHSSVDPTPPLESECNVTQVFLVSSDSFVLGGIPSASIESPPSTKVLSFDWNSLVEPCLPSSIPFQIGVQDFYKNLYHTIMDEGAYVSIYPQLLGRLYVLLSLFQLLIIYFLLIEDLVNL